MSPLLPVALYGLEVPPGEIMIPAAADFPATIRITMAAVDPTEPPEADEDGNIPSVPRSTLKIIKTRLGPISDEDDDEEDEYLQALLGGGDDDEDEDEDEEDDEEEEEANGGPSDLTKSKKARREAALKQLLEATQDDDESDEDMEDAEKAGALPNGVKSKKGKEKATGGEDEEEKEDDDDEDEEDSDDEDGLDLEQFVVCTLDTERNYQQPLDITIAEDEKAFFVVSGTHSVHLIGNYVIDDDVDSDEDEDEDDYDLPPDLEELIDDSDDLGSDELDEIAELERIQEIDTDDEERAAMKPVASAKKGKNKRPAEDDAEGLDDMIAKESNPPEEAKLSKKQLKKLKNNKGEAVKADEETSKLAGTPKSDKKVQFAKNLEQGPTGSSQQVDKKASIGVKVVQGVTIDDRKIGTGRSAKSGDKIGMRYIGKLQNGKVFDSNKKGTPFTFKVGKGEVIKGWDIGCVGMSVGGERRLTIPAHLAYGNKGLPGIPANSTLIFDVKLLEIK